MTINKGDVVRITNKDGIKREGKVLSADYWEGDGGWYIELEDKHYGYCYYKERYDGGKVEKIS